MSNWPIHEIGDLCDVRTGGTPRRAEKENFEGGTIRWIVSADIHQKEIFECENRITERGFKSSNTSLLPMDSVLIALSGQGKTRGTVAMLRVPATCNQSVASMTIKDNSILQPEFLFRYLDGRYQKIRDITGDKDRRGLNLRIVRNIEIPVPPLAEQQRIVAILDEAFNGIALAVSAVEQNLVNARELFECYVSSIFTDLPDGSVEAMLGDIADFKNGLNFSKTSSGEQIHVVGVGNFKSNYWIPMAKLTTVQIDGSLSENYSLKKGDILTVRSNGNRQLIGRCMLANDVSDKTSHSGFTIRIRLNAVDTSPEYVTDYLKSNIARKMLVASGDGTNISNLNQTVLSNLPVPLPDISDQRQISNRIHDLEAMTAKLEVVYRQKLSSLTELKQSILKKAFAGKLTVEPDKSLAAAGL